MTLRTIAAAFLLAQAVLIGAQDIRTLVPGGVWQDSLAGGESHTYEIDVPAQMAARIVVTQDGIDAGYLLRRKGSAVPAHGLDFVAGVEGEEWIVPPVLDTAATWTVILRAALPRASRGRVTVAFDLRPADDGARAVAAARQRHYDASEDAWGGDAVSFQRALGGYAEAAAMADAAGDLAQAAESTYQCARIYDNLGDTPAALAWQKRALEMFRALGRRDREARVLNRLGDLSRKMGDVVESEQYFRQALPLSRETRDPVTEADILNNSGLLLSSIGRLEEAVEQLQSAIPLARQVSSANVEGALEFNIAEIWNDFGHYDRAIAGYQRAYKVLTTLNLPRRLGRNLHFQAKTWFEAGDREKAEDALRRAQEHFKAAGDKAYEAESLAFAGLMAYASGEPERAVELFARVLPVLRDIRARNAEAAVLAGWAEVDLERGEVDEALRKAGQAVEIARAIQAPDRLQPALHVHARALRRAGRQDEAVAAVAQAIESVETMRARMQRSELRTSYLARVRAYYDLYVDLLQQQGRSAEAFAVSERSRARTLLEGLSESAAKISKGVDAGLLDRLRAVQATLNAKENARAQLVLASGERSPRAIAMAGEVERLLEEWNGLRAKIRAASPAYWALQAPEPVTVERLQASLLDTGSALVEYHLGQERSYVWVIDRGAITVAPLPASAAIERTARRYHGVLSRSVEGLAAAERERLAAEGAALAKQLAAVVWAPIANRVRGKRLLIAADGVLHYVPFAALPTASGAPLVAAHEIVYVPSAAVLETLRRDSRAVPARAAVAVFADAVFSTADARLTDPQRGRPEPPPAVMPHAATAATPAFSTSRAATLAERYGRLRFTRSEAEAIGAVSPGAFQALDFSAARQTVLYSDLRKYRVLHFATHGLLDSERPELSGLVLSLVDRRGKPVDGVLRLHEIYNLDLDADLVVLSACQTALGQEVHGEGLIGLTRGFMYAGASRVVSSVWNIDDRASARLMDRFYASMLTKGMTPARALREAQLAMLNEPRWANPHYWAAFGLQGDWQ